MNYDEEFNEAANHAARAIAEMHAKLNTCVMLYELIEKKDRTSLKQMEVLLESINKRLRSVEDEVGQAAVWLHQIPYQGMSYKLVVKE